MPRFSRLVSVSYTESVLVLRLTISKVKVFAFIGVHTTALRTNLFLLVAVRNVIHAQPNTISAVLFHAFSFPLISIIKIGTLVSVLSKMLNVSLTLVSS